MSNKLHNISKNISPIFKQLWSFEEVADYAAKELKNQTKKTPNTLCKCYHILHLYACAHTNGEKANTQSWKLSQWWATKQLNEEQHYSWVMMQRMANNLV